jgi:hypothetical protein
LTGHAAPNARGTSQPESEALGRSETVGSRGAASRTSPGRSVPALRSASPTARA